MEFFEQLLSPIIVLLRFLLELIHPIVGSYGVAIMVLSVAVSLALSPITGLARRLEASDKARQNEMAPLLAEIRRNHSGRDRFEKTDEVYQHFNYHPIKSMGSLLPLLVQLPFLLGALFLLVDYPPLEGNIFLFVPDLGRPDGLLPMDINLLPGLVTGAALLDSWIRPESTAQSRRRFVIVALVLLVLIYPFPAGVCLYWLTANCFALARSAVATRS